LLDATLQIVIVVGVRGGDPKSNTTHEELTMCGE